VCGEPADIRPIATIELGEGVAIAGSDTRDEQVIAYRGDSAHPIQGAAGRFPPRDSGLEFLRVDPAVDAEAVEGRLFDRIRATRAGA
jgi:hypothetical protein